MIYIEGYADVCGGDTWLVEMWEPVLDLIKEGEPGHSCSTFDQNKQNKQILINIKKKSKRESLEVDSAAQYLRPIF